MNCEHTEWTQVQEYADTPWRCAGCGMTMPAWGMVLWNSFGKIIDVKLKQRDAAPDTERKP